MASGFEYQVIVYSFHSEPDKRIHREEWQINGAAMPSLNWGNFSQYLNTQGRAGWELVSSSTSISDASYANWKGSVRRDAVFILKRTLS